MALVVKDRVRETTTTVGTGTLTLNGAVAGFQSFSVIGNGNTTYYTISDGTTGAWEVGIGTYTSSGTTLSRDTVLESSNSNNLVNFTAGTKDVFVTYPADRSVTSDVSTTFTAAQTFRAANAVRSEAAATQDAVVVAGRAGGTNSYAVTVTPTTLSASRTFTLPDADGTALYSGGPLGTPSSGTVTNLTGTASININGTVGATTPNTGAFTTLSASGVATFSAGTVTAPAITTSGDTNNGIYFPAADNIAITTAGVERLRVDSAGNVGIGAAATRKLEVRAGTAGAETVVFETVSGTATVDTTTTWRMTNASGPGLGGGSVELKATRDASGFAARFGIFCSSTGAVLTERFSIDKDGNVGIGVTPVTKLDVNGTATFRNAALFNSSSTAGTDSAAYIRSNNGVSSATTPDYTWWYNDQCGIFHPAGNVIGFSTAGVERLRIDSSGNVGIGTSPGYKLDVYSTSTNQIRYYGSNQTAIYFAGSSGSGGFLCGRGRFNNGGNDFFIYDVVNSAGRFIIDSGGSVGIGTDTPGYKLDVSGQIKCSSGLAVQGSGFATTGYGWELLTESSSIAAQQSYNRTSSSWMTSKWYAADHTWLCGGSTKMTLDSSGNVGIGGASPGPRMYVYSNTAIDTETRYANTQDSKQISIGKQGSSTFGQTSAGDGYIYTDASLSLMVNNATGVMKFATGGNTEKMRIDSSGNVGINQSSPLEKLQVGGSIQLGSPTQNQTTTSSIVNNVPSDPASTARAAITLGTTAGASSSDSYIAFTTNKYGVSRDERMRIDPSGNVGIGTSSPRSKLDVDGIASARAEATAGIAIDVLGRSADNAGIVRFLNNAGNSVVGEIAHVTDFYITNKANNALIFGTNNTERMRIDSSGNVIVNTAAIATNATNGFLYVPTCAGTPTGTPTAYTGRAPIVVDTTNNKLYFYSGGAWRDAGP